MIQLVNMPYAALEHPSLALGLLKSVLVRAGLACEVLYANLRWAEEIGLSAYRLVELTRTEELVGEWTFGPAAFPQFAPDEEAYLESINMHPIRMGGRTHAEAREVLSDLRRRAPEFVERLAREIVSRRPRVLGASSVFQQHCPSLALLRRVKELDPGVVTVIGGANCEGPMGLATVRAFPWIDYTVSGEADELVVPFFTSLLEGRDPVLPPGVLSAAAEQAPRASVRKLDELPAPDFDEYFWELERSQVGERINPGLLLETSRGCWWGQKHHCTFCGLNGGGMFYRSKSAERVLEEMDHLAGRYGVKGFETVDNIMDLAHLKTLFPLLKQRDYKLFYETKSNLKREQVQLMAEAGVNWLQPGIESMHDEVLKLMDKGTTALNNVQLLKWAREFGIRISWNFLVGFPGEKDEWYLEMCEWLPLIAHLQPSFGLTWVRYDRFSPYHQRPEAYGIEMEPYSYYRHVYPLESAALSELAYFFEDVRDPSGVPRSQRKFVRPGLLQLEETISAWMQRFWNGLPPVLAVSDDGELTRFIDTRPVAPSLRQQLSGAERECYWKCDQPQTRSSLGELAHQLESLVERKLVLCVGDRYLALGVRGNLPQLPDPHEFPGGTVLEPGASLRPRALAAKA